MAELGLRKAYILQGFSWNWAKFIWAKWAKMSRWLASFAGLFYPRVGGYG